MVRRGQRRRAYDPVSSAEGEEDVATASEEAPNETFVDEEGDVEAPRRSGRRGRRQYQTVASGEEDNDEDKATVTTDDDDDDDDEECGSKLTIVIMDPAQKKFSIPAYTHWSVKRLKEKGEKVHKVAPSSQRLIYRGKLLQDSSTLEGCGLNSDNLIVHLFPKPRVVIKQQNTTSSCSAAGDELEGPVGAHVPQIVLNPDEAEQRAHILVLGSPDFLEAQNHVKLFSFLLLVISSIEIFNSLLILMGVPSDSAAGSDSYDSGDDFFRITVNNTDITGFNNNAHHNNPYDQNGRHAPDPYQEAAIQQALQTWHPRNNVDLIISAIAVYVAMLGVRATNETTLRLAQQYLAGTILVGFAWMVYNLWSVVHVDEEVDEFRREEQHNQTGNATHPGEPVIYDDDVIPYKTEWEYYQQNLSLMMIPGIIWVLCCVRAWQFQSLLGEAEQEAHERIQNELAQYTANEQETVAVHAARVGGRRQATSRAPTTLNLELQNRSAMIS
jgi:Ubiquitin family